MSDVDRDANALGEAGIPQGKIRSILKTFWDDLVALPLPFKILVIFIVAAGVSASAYVMFIGMLAKQASPSAEIRDITRKAKSDQQQGRPSPYYEPNLPVSNRNQGLEEVLAKFETLNQRLDQMERNQSLASTRSAPGTPGAAQDVSSQDQASKIDLDKPIRSTPTYSIPARNPTANAPTADSTQSVATLNLDQAAATAPAVPAQPVKEPVSSPPIPETPTKKKTRVMSVARYSAVESVILVGFFARSAASPNAAGAADSGSGTSTNAALGVGARFVALIKGDLMMPNGFRSGALDSCFVGGSAIGSLSDSRAKAIAEAISCISPDGQITDIPVKGYVQDADGTNGIAGNLVNKQGPIVMRSALAGLASGIGQAISPYQVPGLNSTAGGIAFPSVSEIARTAAGQGISNASSQLAAFYLSYAKETLPGVEVTAGSRVTWVFTEPFDIELPASGAKK